jgi:phytoene dehydrogenase-like protein
MTSSEIGAGHNGLVVAGYLARAGLYLCGAGTHRGAR